MNESQVEIIPEPAWLDDLIIYEIATRAFTSPNGPESGTFKSLQEKLPYLKDLGINGIWLSGHSLSDENHFYNIWTQYAAIEPDQIDPRLGTPEDFKNTIAAAHKHGIKIFLDVISHGVMANSSLITKYPHWFKSGSWGMVDYDWHGNHSDLDQWWVNLWVNMVTEYGVDGFRIDVAFYRHDLWLTIRSRCLDAGHEIVIMGEHGPACKGLVSLHQRENCLSDQFKGVDVRHKAFNNLSAFIHEKTLNDYKNFQCKISYDTGEIEVTHILENEKDEVIRVKEAHTGYLSKWFFLRLKNPHPEKSFKNIIIKEPNEGSTWKIDFTEEGYGSDYLIKLHEVNSEILLSFQARTLNGQPISLQLSCHDNGWEGYSKDSNPYAAIGSRVILGYSFIFAPAIPLFMSGEEFNAHFRPLPHLCPRLYDKNNPGKGTWAYGSWIDWEQLNIKSCSDMLDDVRRMIAIRTANKHLIKPMHAGDSISQILPINASSKEIPVPYLYSNSDEALLIAGNPDDTKEKCVSFEFPFTTWGLRKYSKFQVEDIWNGDSLKEFTKDALLNFKWQIKPDKKLRGGLIVLKMKGVK